MTAENELVEKLAKTLHRFLCAARNIEWEAGDTCDDCKDDIQKVLLPIIRDHANALVGAAYAVCASIDLEDADAIRDVDDAQAAHYEMNANEMLALTPEAAAKELERAKVEQRLEQLARVLCQCSYRTTYMGKKVTVASIDEEWLSQERIDLERQLAALSKKPVAKEAT